MDIVTTLYGRQERSWQIQANCMGVDPDLFFPERGASTREAKEVCRGCVVREDCLEYALANGEKFGIWGGMSERERRRVRRARALQRRDSAVQRLLSWLSASQAPASIRWPGPGGPRPSCRHEAQFGPAGAWNGLEHRRGEQADQLSPCHGAPASSTQPAHGVVEPGPGRAEPDRPGCTRPGPARRRPGRGHAPRAPDQWCHRAGHLEPRRPRRCRPPGPLGPRRPSPRRSGGVGGAEIGGERGRHAV